MKNIKDFIVSESIVANDKILQSIQNVLNKKLKDRSFAIDIKSMTNYRDTSNIPMGFETTDDLMYDIAGYLVKLFVWNILNNDLFTDSDFQNEWLSDVQNQMKGVINANKEFKPIVRRSQKGKYWDFELPGVDGKFEIKARSIKEGKSGGFRYTDYQKNDKNLVYIYIKYKVNDKNISIDSIEVKRK